MFCRVLSLRKLHNLQKDYILKYKKKPVVIEAIQFNNGFDIATMEKSWTNFRFVWAETGFKIPTLEGEMHVSLGDYVIKGVNGEFYPCKPDIFLKSYDAV